MTSPVEPQSSVMSRRPSLLVALLVGATVMTMGLGVRQTLGLFVEPFSTERGVPVTVFALAVALHNLVWGLAQPFSGAAADRYGAGPVISTGAVLYALGLAVSAIAPTGAAALVGVGILTGLGVSCTTFGVVLAAIGRAAPPEKRSMAFGLASAGGAVGQMGLLPLTSWTLTTSGIQTALLVLAACLLAVVPLGFFLEGRLSTKTRGSEEAATLSFAAAVAEARRHPGYVLMTIGFFSCGFQIAFIATHLPGYLTLCHMPLGLGATALAVIGFFNIFGSYACGWLGQRFRPQHCLAWLYLVRSAAIVVFFYGPKTPTTVLVFAAVMGLLWFGVAPLTNGLIARMFGVGNIGVLFGVAFLSHQIGAFLGAWLGGLLFDFTGSFDAVWLLTAAAGVFAALMHFPIRDRPRHVLVPS